MGRFDDCAHLMSHSWDSLKAAGAIVEPSADCIERSIKRQRILYV